MENNEIMLNDEVIEATEEIATVSNKGLVVAGAVVGTLVVGALVYTKIIKPAIARAKAKKKTDEVFNAEYYGDVEGDVEEGTED